MISTFSWLGLIGRIFIGGYFLYAAIPKIIEPLAFATSISHYGLLPSWSVNAYALVLPWLELLIGGCLVIGYSIRTNAILAGLLILMFTAAVGYAVVLGLSIDCGCFGADGGEEVSWFKVAKNLGMVAVCVWLTVHPATALALDRHNGKSA